MARLEQMKGGDYVVYNLDFALLILHYDKSEMAVILKENAAFERFLKYVTPTRDNNGEKIVFTVNDDGIKEARIFKARHPEGVFFNCCIRDADISINFKKVKNEWIWYKRVEE